MIFPLKLHVTCKLCFIRSLVSAKCDKQPVCISNRCFHHSLCGFLTIGVCFPGAFSSRAGVGTDISLHSSLEGLFRGRKSETIKSHVKPPAHSMGTRDRGGIPASQTPQSFFPSLWRSWIHLQILLQLLEAGRWGTLP